MVARLVTRSKSRRAIQSLAGDGPGDLMEVTFGLGVEMLILGGLMTSRGEARAKLEKLIRTVGQPRNAFKAIIAAQGGDPRVVDDPGLLPQAAGAVEIYNATRRGFIGRVEPRAIGRAIIEMGGGRSKIDDAIDASVGMVLTAKAGWTGWSRVRRSGRSLPKDRAGVENGASGAGDGDYDRRRSGASVAADFPPSDGEQGWRRCWRIEERLTDERRGAGAGPTA